MPLPLLLDSNVVEPANDAGAVARPRADGEPKPESRIEALTGLRGLMALYVTIEHLACYQFHPAIAAILAPFSLGLPGHALFFVLTGFGLARSMSRHARHGTSPSLGAYLIARWRRLAPPYYATIVLCLAIPTIALTDGRLLVRVASPDLYTLLTHVLFLHSLNPDTSRAISTPLWSLSLIFQFYLVFPLLYTAMGRWDYRAVAAGVIALWLAIRLLLKLLALSQGFPPTVFWGFILCRLPTFTLGMAVAYWSGSPRRGRGGNPTPVTLGLTAAVLLGGSVVTQGGYNSVVTELLRGVGYTALLLAALTSARRGGRLGRLLSRPALAGLGTISYGLYLTHDLVFSRLCAAYRHFVPDPGLGGDASLVAVGLVLALAVAWAMYHLIEKPSMRLGASRA
jgi:peptidoglycan/LPS O-acetylase OafA/YrhL